MQGEHFLQFAHELFQGDFLQLLAPLVQLEIRHDGPFFNGPARRYPGTFPCCQRMGFDRKLFAENHYEISLEMIKDHQP